MEKLVKRINELSKLAKERDLTPDEIMERQKLRKKYLGLFRQNFESQLKNVTVVDEQGQDVTPEKIKKMRKEENNER